jgi:hypothetical protein
MLLWPSAVGACDTQIHLAASAAIFTYTRGLNAMRLFCFILHQAAALAGRQSPLFLFIERERETLAHTQSSTKECHFSVLFAKSSQANRFSLCYIYYGRRRAQDEKGWHVLYLHTRRQPFGERAACVCVRESEWDREAWSERAVMGWSLK